VSEQVRVLANSMSNNGQLQKTVENFSETSHELRLAVGENRAMLRQTLQNFSEASLTAKRLTSGREAELRKAMDHFSHAAENLDRLSTRLDSLRASIQVITSKVEKGDGTLGKLVNDQKLYTELNTSVQSLRALIEDVKRNPKKYLKISVF
jgi:phospholipid/cholesterol/gamma-HCH transport system substrate-binding protein